MERTEHAETNHVTGDPSTFAEGFFTKPVPPIYRVTKGLNEEDIAKNNSLWNILRRQSAAIVESGGCGTIDRAAAYNGGTLCSEGWPCRRHLRSQVNERVLLVPEEERLSGEDTSDPFKVPIAEIDTDQSWNPRSVISQAQLKERIEGLKNSGKPDQDILVFPHDAGSKYKWRVIGGNITLLAANALVLRGDQRFTELWCREIKGDRRKAGWVASRNNESHQSTSSYDKARDLHAKKKEFGYRSTEELVADARKFGWTISVSTADNLISAINQCVPEILKAWQYANVPLDEKPLDVLEIRGGGARVDIDVNDMFINWIKGRDPSEQHRVWSRMRRGEQWKAIKAELDAKKVGITSEKTFFGTPFKPRPPKLYSELLIGACRDIRAAQLDPAVEKTALTVAESVTKHVLTGMPGDRALLKAIEELRQVRVAAPAKQSVAKATPKPQLKEFLDECCTRTGVVKSSDLLRAYGAWAKRTKAPELTSKAFGAQLLALGFEQARIGAGGARGWRGLALKGTAR